MNPSVDLFSETDELVEDGKSRCQTPSREPGGGGLNVARSLHRMGCDVLAVFPAGGLNGEILEQLARREKIPHRGIRIAGETRENLAITERSSGNLLHFVFPGPQLAESEWRACLKEVTTLDPAPRYLVLSGSLPEGMPADFYGRIAATAALRGTNVVLDTSGSALQPALQAGVYLAKLNQREFDQLGFSHSNDAESLLQAMANAVADGLAGVLIVTLGSQGALFVSQSGEKAHISPPATKVVSHVGAGDAFVAVLLDRLQRGLPLQQAVCYGVAAAAAAVKTSGNQIKDLGTVETLYQQVQIKQNG